MKQYFVYVNTLYFMAAGIWLGVFNVVIPAVIPAGFLGT
jgi:hypothetical protein